MGRLLGLGLTPHPPPSPRRAGAPGSRPLLRQLVVAGAAAQPSRGRGVGTGCYARTPPAQRVLVAWPPQRPDAARIRPSRVDEGSQHPGSADARYALRVAPTSEPVRLGGPTCVSSPQLASIPQGHTYLHLCPPMRPVGSSPASRLQAVQAPMQASSPTTAVLMLRSGCSPIPVAEGPIFSLQCAPRLQTTTKPVMTLHRRFFLCRTRRRGERSAARELL